MRVSNVFKLLPLTIYANTYLGGLGWGR